MFVAAILYRGYERFIGYTSCMSLIKLIINEETCLHIKFLKCLYSDLETTLKPRHRPPCSPKSYLHCAHTLEHTKYILAKRKFENVRCSDFIHGTWMFRADIPVCSLVSIDKMINNTCLHIKCLKCLYSDLETNSNRASALHVALNHICIVHTKHNKTCIS